MATTTGSGTAGTTGAARAGGGMGRGAAFGLLVLANVLWAGTYTAGKIALGELSPVELNAVRFTLAALLLAPALWRYRQHIPRDRRSLMVLAQLALLGFVLNKAFEYAGLALSTASDVALLIAAESVFTALLSWIFLREPVRRSGVAALVLGLTGAYLIVERGMVPRFDAGGGSARIVGDVLVIVSLLLEAGYTVRGKTTLATVPPIVFTSLTILGGLFVWIPAGLVAVAREGMPHVTGGGALAVLYMAAVATAAGYWLWFRALSAVDASAAAPTLFIQPLLGTALAIILLHDILTLATVVGAVLIFGSLLLVLASGRRTRAVAVEAGEPVP